MSRHVLSDQAAFEAAVLARPAARECRNGTGAVEHLLRGEIADLPATQHFHQEALSALAGIATLTSTIVLGSPKDERG